MSISENPGAENPDNREELKPDTIYSRLSALMDEANAGKLARCSPEVLEPIHRGVVRMTPSSIFINTGSAEDLDYVRRQALARGEEELLAIPNHYCHFDGPNDQGRDMANTGYLARDTTAINSLQTKKELRAGLEEIADIMEGIMTGREMIVSFIFRGPIGCEATDPTMQITDSYYVIHSEALLYRMAGPTEFSRDVAEKGYMFVNYHSAGELTKSRVSADLQKRRIYMDVENFRSYSANCQYAGNSIAPKKINHRFANMNNLRNHFGQRLDEHMFITGFDLEGETIYFAGAYPSGCGKTGTAMTGARLIGDDLAKIFIDLESGEVRAVNPERGMFGIIEGINREEDPETMNVLENGENEVIFSNLLISDGKPYWQGMGKEPPERGRNYAGEWTRDSGRPPSHKNARFTFALDALENYDPAIEDHRGVKLSVLIYGGRDYTTMPAIVMAHDWTNTVVHGAIIRSSTTATEIGTDGSEKRSPFANEAFFPGPLCKYIKHYLAFGENPRIGRDKLPSGFQVNYWLHKSARGPLAPGECDGLLGDKNDTGVWMRIMALMHLGKVETIRTPIGRIPKYPDLQKLFREMTGKDYPEETYTKQFSLYIDRLLGRIDLSIAEFSEEKEMPEEFFHTLNGWKRELLTLKAAVGPVATPEQIMGLS
ncbi:MAG: phosphoenolpyruvate carboxykinase domain-containing protein [Desulfurivibrionaceae bacterium]